MSGLEIHDTEYLKSIFVAVGKGQVGQFEREIYGLGSELVRYGGCTEVRSGCTGIDMYKPKQQQG